MPVSLLASITDTSTRCPCAVRSVSRRASAAASTTPDVVTGISSSASAANCPPARTDTCSIDETSNRSDDGLRSPRRREQDAAGERTSVQRPAKAVPQRDGQMMNPACAERDPVSFRQVLPLEHQGAPEAGIVQRRKRRADQEPCKRGHTDNREEPGEGCQRSTALPLLHRSQECNCPNLVRRLFSTDRRIASRLTLAQQHDRSPWLGRVHRQPSVGEQLTLAF